MFRNGACDRPCQCVYSVASYSQPPWRIIIELGGTGQEQLQAIHPLKSVFSLQSIFSTLGHSWLRSPFSSSLGLPIAKRLHATEEGLPI
jgi:hypothetical protein